MPAFNYDFMPGVNGQMALGGRPVNSSLTRQRWAKITGSAGSNPTLYSWTEQTWQPLAPGGPKSIGLADMSGGAFGTTAFNPVVDPNDGTHNVGDFVLIQEAYFDPVLDLVYAMVPVAGVSSGGTPPLDNSFWAKGASNN